MWPRGIQSSHFATGAGNLTFFFSNIKFVGCHFVSSKIILFENENRKCQRNGILYNDLHNNHETTNATNSIKLALICNVREAQLCVMVYI